MDRRDPCGSSGESFRDASRRTVTVRVSYANAAAVLDVVRPLFARGDVVVVVLAAPGRVDLALVDALARLVLCARRQGGEVQVRVEGEQVKGLVALTGLSAVLSVGTGSGQPGRQSQALEEVGAEEVVHVRDPSA